jgi:autotransporter adhesin
VGNTAAIAVKYDAAGGDLITLGATGGAGAAGPVTITNLADGAVTDTSSDAVNGSQLFAVSQQQGETVDALGESVAQTFGAGATYDAATGTVGGFSQTLNPVSATGAVGAGTPSTTVGGALTALNASVGNTAAIAVKYDAAGGDLITLGATGGAGAAGPVTITNLADGAVTDTSSDAVNGSQLYDLINGGVTVRYFNVNSTKIDSIASGADSISIGPAAIATANSSIALGNEASASSEGSVAIGASASDNGRGGESYTGKYSGVVNETAGTVSFGNEETGQLRTLSNVADAKNATDAVNLRQLDGAVVEAKQYTDQTVQNINTEIGNIGNAVNNNTTDIAAVKQNVTSIENGQSGMMRVNKQDSTPAPTASGRYSTAGGAGATASGARSTSIGYNAKASSSNSVALGANSVANRDNSVSVGSKGNERQITNVAAGTADSDAVNVGQLNSSVANITSQSNEYANQKFKALKSQIDDQDNVLSAGIASAMSMASMPQPYAPGGKIVSMGAASYRGESAISLGVSHISENGRWVTKFQLTRNTQNDTGAGVGVGYQW